MQCSSVQQRAGLYVQQTTQCATIECENAQDAICNVQQYNVQDAMCDVPQCDVQDAMCNVQQCAGCRGFSFFFADIYTR